MHEVNVVWVGPRPAPMRWIATWGSVSLHGNDVLRSRKWALGPWMRHYAKRGEWNGVADCMRWELLYDHGGFFVDADSEKLRDIPDSLFESGCFSCWENEALRPGLIACGALYAKPKNEQIGRIIGSIMSDTPDDRLAWEAVGPMAITREADYSLMTVYPSHFFIPEHFAGHKYQGGGPVYARQHWASTRKAY